MPIKQKTDQPIINPYLAVLLGVTGAGFSSIFTKLAEAPPLIIAFYRLSFTVLILAPFTFARGTGELRQMGKKDIILASFSGIMLALHFAVWIASLNYTSIASSTVLVTMHPLFVITGGYVFYREGIRPIGLAGACLAVVGSVIIGVSDFQVGGQALYGDLLAFSGAIFVAGYVLIGRGLRTHLSLLPYIFVVYGMASLVLFLSALLLGNRLGPYPAWTWIYFLALALVPTIGGHTVFNWALKYVKAAVVSVTILGEPIGATVLAYLIFHQVPTALQLLGGSIIIAGLAIFIWSSRGEGKVVESCVQKKFT